MLGFGLVEVLIAAGLAGGLALTIAKLSQNANRVTKTTESNNEINLMLNDVAYILSDKDNCNASIPSGTPANGAAISGIRRVGPPLITKYVPGTVYGNGTFTISSMQTETVGTDTNLVFGITRNNDVVYGSKSITKRIPLKAVVDSGNITSCFSDTDSMISTAVQKACQGNTARYDAVSGECYHDVVGDPADICGPNQAYKEISTSGGTLRIRCQAALNALSCPAGKFINGIDASGSPICSDLVTGCTAGSYLKILTGGALACVVIPSYPINTVLFSRPDGSFDCSTSTCGVNQYLQGINSNGTAVCKTIPNGQCGSGQYVKEVKGDGTLVCGAVPAAGGLTVDDYSFADGYDTSTGSWTRKTIDQTAQKICERMSGFSWTGTKCLFGGGSGGTSIKIYKHIDNTLTTESIPRTVQRTCVYCSGGNGAPAATPCDPGCDSTIYKDMGTTEAKAMGYPGGGNCGPSGKTYREVTKTCKTDPVLFGTVNSP